MTVNTTTIRIWSMILMPKNILRCSASLRMDGIAKRLITTEMAVEIKGAIQRYFLFQKKKNTTDTMGMIQNTEIFHQFISIPLLQNHFFFLFPLNFIIHEKHIQSNLFRHLVQHLFTMVSELLHKKQKS